MKRAKISGLVLLVVVGAALLSACGDNTPTTPATTAAATATLAPTTARAATTTIAPTTAPATTAAPAPTTAPAPATPVPTTAATTAAPAPTTAAAAATAKTVNISIMDFKFVNDTVTIPVGTKVIWTNKDSSMHNVQTDSGAFKSNLLGQNQTFEFTFNTAGTFEYYCAPHPFMKAKIVVTAS